MYGTYHYVNCINVLNNVVDDQDLTRTELTYMINLLCNL